MITPNLMQILFVLPVIKFIYLKIQTMNLKKITMGFVLAIACNQVKAQLPSAAPYCEPAFTNQYNMLNTINVKGKNFPFGAVGSWGKKDPFQYYNNITFPDFIQDDTASIELVPYAPNDGEPIYFAIWIDYNGNKTFETSELVMQNANTIKKELPVFGAPITPIKLTVTVPATAVAGKTRMRVMRGENSADKYKYSATYSLSPCPVAAANNYGCTYDFDINIKAKKPTGTNEYRVSDRIVFHPNPARGGMIRISEEFKDGALRIMDIGGRVVLQQDKAGNVPVNISGLQAGQYTVSVSQAGKAYVQSLLVTQ